jgi:hypothetical protein
VVEVRDDDWPWSTVPGEEETVGTVSAGLTVSVNDAVAVLPFESVTVRVTVNGEPVVAEGVQLMEAAFVVLHPVGRFVHT